MCIAESFCKSLFTLKGEGFYKSARLAYVEERRVILFLGRRNDNLSSGSIYTTTLLNNLRRLRVEQRRMSRRFKKGAKKQSKGYQKQKMVVAKVHERIRNQRRDYLHKKSTQIIRAFDTICLEDLNIQGMMQNRKLALAIGEVGWGKFKSMLEYKADWYGKNIRYVGRFEPTSKMCSHCGYILKNYN